MSTNATEAQFEDSPRGWAQRWSVEFAAAREALQEWHTLGDVIDKRLRDEEPKGNEHETHWNLFPADVARMQAMLYGRIPTTSVGRRFQDADDDIARVGAEMLKRLLDCDIERAEDGFCSAMGYALMDRLGPGFGNVRYRYVVGETVMSEGQEAKVDPLTGRELAPAVAPVETRPNEQVETDYFHWKDQLWSPCRTFHEARWWAFKTPMTREALEKRFDPKLAKLVPLNSKRSKDENEKRADPWARADVWEVWDKEHRRQFFYVEGFDQVLENNEDPLGLTSFWPFERPMFAGLTTSKLVPVPDFKMARDQYDEIDRVSSRITALERAISVRGAYDRSNAGLKQLLSEAGANELIPVDNWNTFSAQGGIEGAVSWMPLGMVVEALLALRDYRRELIDALYQIRGTSDIMRGQATQPGATATEQRLKTRFGSIVVQAAQDDFARFASGGQRIKAEIIARHFDPATIITRSNIERTQDADKAQAAAELIKSDPTLYRVEIKPEAINHQDMGALNEERTELLAGVGSFLQVVAPLVQMFGPSAMPFFLEWLKWRVAGMRAASSIEAVIDKYIAQFQDQAQQAAQNPQQQPPDPKLQATQMKIQGDMAKEQAKLQNDLVRINAEVQADAAREQNQMRSNVFEHAQKQSITNALKPPEPAKKPGGIQG